MKTVVIGVGNEFRGDDAVGRIVARRLSAAALDGVVIHESTGEALSLMTLWQGAERALLIDAADFGASPGTVRRFDVGAQPLPAASFRASTHAFSVAEAIEMARALAQLPRHLIVFAVQCTAFDHGAGLSAAAELGAREALRLIHAELSPPAGPQPSFLCTSTP